MPAVSSPLKRTPLCLGVILVLAAAVLFAPCRAAAQNAPADTDSVPGEFIVKYRPERLQQLRIELPALDALSDEELKEALTETMNALTVETVPLADAESIRANSGNELDIDAALDLIDADLVEYISPNYLHQATAVPNDPSYGSLWGMNQANDVDINAPEAWDITTGGSDPVVVGVVDTGVDYTHPDLVANMWTNAAEASGTPGVDDDMNGYVDDVYGYNGINNSGNPMDDNNHGTHCAGTIGGRGNNGIGVVGVAWNVRIMGLKFLNAQGQGSDVDAIKAINYAINMKNRGVNIRVLSNSWGGGGYNPAMATAIQNANDAGMLFVAAAGNSTSNNDATANYPSNYTAPNVVAVAAVGQDGSIASFSSYGATTVDLGAPGVGIYSTVRGGSYASFNGTSMATPHVSGVAALVFSRVPGFTPVDVKSAILNSVKPLASLSGKTVTGGMLNARDALADPTNFPPVLTPIPDQTISPISRVKTVNILVTDQENAPLTVTASILVPQHQQVAADFDAQYNVTSYQSQFDNYYRLNEKRILTGDGKTFYLLPDGKIYELIGYGFEFRGAVDPLYHQTPSLLVNANPVNTGSMGSVQVLTNPHRLTITTAVGYTGTFSIRVNASDGNRSDSKTFLVTVRNNAPVLQSIADRTMAASADYDTVNVHADDPDGDPVTFSAQIATENEAYSLDQRYNFTAYMAQYDNQAGLSEKYLSNGSGQWFFVLPEGKVFLLAEPVYNSTYLGNAGASAYQNPATLVNVASPGPAPATVSTTALGSMDARVTINPNTGFRGNLRVTVNATDTIAATSATFVESIAESAPVLTVPATLTAPARVRSVTFTASATDADNDPLVFSAQLENSTLPAQLDGQYNFTEHRADWYNGYGRNEKFLTSPSGYFYLLPDGRIYRWAGSMDLSVLEGQLPSYFYDDPGLLIDAPAPPNVSGVTFAVSPGSGSAQVSVTAPFNYVGSFWVRVSVSDGIRTTAKRVVVSITNSAPVFNDLSAKNMGVSQTTMSIPIPMSDSDGDGIVLTVTGVQSLADQFRVFQMSRRVTEYRTASDNRLGQGEKWFAGFDGREYFLLSNGGLYEWRGSLDLSPLVYTLDTSYHSDPSRLALAGHVVVNYLPEKDNELGVGEKYLEALDGQLYFIKPDGSFHIFGGSLEGSSRIRNYPTSYYATPSSIVNQSNQAKVVATVSGNTLTVTRQVGYVDTFTVGLRASDGFSATTGSLRITVQNQTPVILPLSDRVLPSSVVQDIVRFTASDPDGESVTIVSEIINYEKAAADACRALNLLSYIPASDNANGLGEKYFSSQSGQWYFLKSNGVMHRFSGTVSGSPVVYTIDSSFHSNPADLLRLCAVQVPSPGTIQRSGPDLVYTRNGSYRGTFRVRVTATDPNGAAANISYRVTVQNQPPVLLSIVDRVMGESEMVIAVPLSASDPESNALSFSAQVLPANATAAGLAMLQYQLRAYVPQFDDYRGMQEKYLTAANGALYFLLSDGKLYRAGRTIESSTEVATLGAEFYENPQALIDTPAVPTSGLPTAQVSGTTLTLTRESTFGGVFSVRVTVSDGMASDTKSFMVNAVPKTVVVDPIIENTSPASDTDGDGVADADEVDQGSDPFDAGSFQQPISGPLTYSLWNSFLGMTNILEMVNPEDEAKNIRVLLFSIDGAVASERVVTVPPRSQFDLILNDLPGFVADSYGLVRIEFEGLIDGRMFYYRPKSGTGDFEFSFGVPLANPSFGNTVVGFNTFQPSLAPEEQEFVVANWLTLVNLSPQGKMFNVVTYGQDGAELMRRELYVAGYGRTDVDGGHGLAGSSVVGLHNIEPADPTSPYIAQLIRYGGKAPAGVMPTEYNFAFPLTARAGTGRTLHVPISDQFSESNWVEVANALDRPVAFRISFIGDAGQVLGQAEDILPAHGQRHFFASSFLPTRGAGVVKIEPAVPNALIAQSMFYFREASTGRMSAMYGSQAKQSLGRALFGSYNLFLGMENYLKVVNTSTQTARAQVIVNSAQGTVEKIYDIASNGITVLPIHDFAQFHTVPNSYGTVEVRMTEGASAYSELIRIRKSGANVDFAAPTTVR